jgi:hypothetical protein
MGIGVMAMYIHDWRVLVLACNAPFVAAVSFYWCE